MQPDPTGAAAPRDRGAPRHAEQLLAQIARAGLRSPERDHPLDPEGRWVFDLCWVAPQVAVAVEGGAWFGGRGTGGAGFARDCAGSNAAVLAGWRLLRVTGAMVASGEALDAVAAALALCGVRARR